MKDRIFPPHGRRKHDFLHHIQVPPQKKCVLIQVPSPERRSFLSPSGCCPSCLRCRRRRHRCIGQLESVLRGAHPCLLLWLSRVRFALQSMWLARCMLSCNQALSSCFRALLTAFHAARLAALGGCLCAACRCSRSWWLSRNLCWGGGNGYGFSHHPHIWAWMSPEAGAWWRVAPGSLRAGVEAASC